MRRGGGLDKIIIFKAKTSFICWQDTDHSDTQRNGQEEGGCDAEEKEICQCNISVNVLSINSGISGCTLQGPLDSMST